MSHRYPQENTFPDKETLLAWENMRIEVLHELQEGASADVPDSYLNHLGNLVIKPASGRHQRKLRLAEVLNHLKDLFSKSVN